jgi:acyl carrier protein
MNIAAQVKNLVADHFDLDPSSISEKASFVDDLGADSLAITELTLALEEEFEIEIDDEEMGGVKTVGDAIAYIGTRSVAD